MALQKEIWAADIVEGLFADNTFAARSLNHSMWVSGRTVHIPNAGKAPTVSKGRASLPATAAGRADLDLSYTIGEFTTDPVVIPNADLVELSYDKRQSVLAQIKSALADSVHDDLLDSWVSAASSDAVVTPTGADGADIKAAIIKAKTLLDKADVPQTGRCLLLSPDYYNALLTALTDSESIALASTADAASGIIGRKYGFDIYMRSYVGKTSTQTIGGLVWQQDCVAHALGNVEVFEDEKSPSYYGDVLSALVRAGGSIARSDKAGVALIV